MVDTLSRFSALFLPLYMQMGLYLGEVTPKQLQKRFKRTLICRNARLFNGRVVAADAFKWDLEKMLQFLSKAAENPNYYGVHGDHHHTLVTAIGKLEGLRSVTITSFCKSTR